MKTQEITLCGKQATLAYCYATEIAYNDLAGEDINDFMQTVGASIQDNRMPDAKSTIFLIIAAMLAYYQSQGEEAPIKDTDLMNEVTPAELGTALGTVLSLRAAFYRIPEGEPKDTAPGSSADGKSPRKRKNA